MENRMWMVVAGLLTLSGCGATSSLEQQYGEAVRQMISAQAYDPSTLREPSSRPVEGADPDMVNTAIQSFREQVGAPEEVGQDIVIDLGGATGGG